MCVCVWIRAYSVLQEARLIRRVNLAFKPKSVVRRIFCERFFAKISFRAFQTNFPTLLWWNNNNNNNNNRYHPFHVKLKCKRWASPLEKLALCIRRRLDRSRSPFSRGIFENCIDKRKQRIKGSRTKRKQKERRGLPFSRDPVSAGCQDKDSRRSGREKRERQFLLKGCYPAASIPFRFEARHGPDTTFSNGVKWLATVVSSRAFTASTYLSSTSN